MSFSLFVVVIVFPPKHPLFAPAKQAVRFDTYFNSLNLVQNKQNFLRDDKRFFFELFHVPTILSVATFGAKIDIFQISYPPSGKMTSPATPKTFLCRMPHSASLRKQPFLLDFCRWGREERGETAFFKCPGARGP